MEISTNSIERFSTGSLMIAHLGEDAAGIQEDEQVQVTANVVHLGTAMIVSAFERQGFPDPSEEKPFRIFANDLKREGLIPVPTNETEPEGIGQITSVVEDMNKRGVGRYRVEYQATWDPEENWKAKIDGEATSEDHFETFETAETTNPDPDADKFKTAAEMNEASTIERHSDGSTTKTFPDGTVLNTPVPATDDKPEDDCPFKAGGHFYHAGSKYEIFDVRPDTARLQGAAVYSGTKPNVVMLNFEQVKGYEEPLNAMDIDVEVAFDSPAVQNYDELTRAYEKAVEVTRMLIKRNAELEGHLRSIVDPRRSVLINLEPHLEILNQKHNPATNSPQDILGEHMVASIQLATERLAMAMARGWCPFDHHVQDNSHCESLKITMDTSMMIEFVDLRSASISAGKLKLKLSESGGVSLTYPVVIQAGSKSPDEPTLFDEKAFRPTIAIEAEQEVEADGDTDVPDIELENPEEEDIDVPAIAGEDPDDPLFVADYGVALTDSQFESLTGPQKTQVKKWMAIMGGEKGTKTFPTCLRSFAVIDTEAHKEAGATAYREGVKPYKHERTPGAADHFFWKSGYDWSKKETQARVLLDDEETKNA
jgi:hypothetical protein